jgi:magnesium chelatase family protein
MQHARVFTISSGAWPRPVELDATHRPGIRWELIGFTERIVRESPQRVRHAWRSTRQPWPSGKWVISLSPAALPKPGAAVDLPLALAIHLAHRRKSTNLWAMGELHFDGRVLPVPGIPALVSIALAQGADRILLPQASQEELGDHPKIRYVSTLEEAFAQLDFWEENEESEPALPRNRALESPERQKASFNFWDSFQGNPKLQWAALVAVHGGHHAFFWAKPKFPWSNWVATVQQLHYGRLEAAKAPFREFPTRLITSVMPSLGSTPGLMDPFTNEVTQANGGILAMGRWLEQDPRIEDRLAAVLERGTALLGRGQDHWAVPARFQLVLASAPCACGPIVSCICSNHQLRAWKQKIRKPFLERLDLGLDEQKSEEFSALSWTQALDQLDQGEKIWTQRFVQSSEERWTNRQVPVHRMLELFHANKDTLAWFEKEQATARWMGCRMAQILRIARSLADLQGKDTVEIHHMKQAVQLNTAFST